MDWLFPALAAVCSFAGSYAAIGVHIKYLRRDVDTAHSRIDSLERVVRYGRKT